MATDPVEVIERALLDSGEKPDFAPVVAMSVASALREAGLDVAPRPEFAGDAIEALAESWASIDGNLERFRATKGEVLREGADGTYAGYMAEAAEMARRLKSRGYVVERDWQDISTAPKDGTPIQITRQGSNVGPLPVEITYWYEIPLSHYEHVEGDLYRKVDDAPHEGWNGNGHRATHWRPLPTPPGGA